MSQSLSSPLREGEATMMRRRSNALLAVRAHQILIDQTLRSLEEISLAGESRLQSAGKGAFRLAMETQSETTHAGAAQRLYDAVTGYLFRACFPKSSPPTAPGLEDFRRHMREGIEQGTFESRRLLHALGQRGVVADHAIMRTMDLLRSRLDRWFERQAESFDETTS